jgi:hypothetical protein
MFKSFVLSITNSCGMLCATAICHGSDSIFELTVIGIYSLLADAIHASNIKATIMPARTTIRGTRRQVTAIQLTKVVSTRRNPRRTESTLATNTITEPRLRDTIIPARATISPIVLEIVAVRDINRIDAEAIPSIEIAVIADARLAVVVWRRTYVAAATAVVQVYFCIDTELAAGLEAEAAADASRALVAEAIAGAAVGGVGEEVNTFVVVTEREAGCTCHCWVRAGAGFAEPGLADDTASSAVIWVR